MSIGFVLNTKLHHVGLSWIISSIKKMKYDIKENNHPDWLNKDPRYNTAKMLGLNSFITMIKLEKKIRLMKLWKSYSKKYQPWNPNHLVTIKNTSCYWHILAVHVTWHTLQPEIIVLLIRKHNYFLPVRGNLFVVCNLTDVRYSVEFNVIKWVVADVAWTL